MNAPFRESRRNSLKILGGVSALGILQGCCGLAPRAPELGDLSLPPLRENKKWIHPFLPEKAGITPNEFPCIDVHAHFFNASDVNVKDYLAECIGHEIEDPIIRKMVEEFAPIVAKLAWLAPTAKEEYRYLTDVLGTKNANAANLLDVDSPLA